jgi:hypothetical protein
MPEGGGERAQEPGTRVRQASGHRWRFAKGQLITELSGAAREQSTGIDQVGHAVAQLDQVTQQNAALVEESAAAAESLKIQAANLAEAVRVFKLAEA